MTAFALSLLLLSAGIHATWNLLAKRASEKLPFLWCGTVASALMFFPAGAWLLATHPVPARGWLVLAGSSCIEAVYYWSLSQAYRHGDLSIVYPIARATAPLVVPILATIFLGERLSVLAACGILLVVLGALVAHLPSASVAGLRALAQTGRGLGTRYALLTGVLIASYSTLDKFGVSLIAPPLYAYLLFLGVTIGLVPLLFPRRQLVRAEWNAHRGAILVVGALSPIAYGLVLLAFSLAPVSYVAAAREVSVVVGAFLGVVVLHEPHGPHRIVGSILIVGGLVLLVLG